MLVRVELHVPPGELFFGTGIASDPV